MWHSFLARPRTGCFRFDEALTMIAQCTSTRSLCNHLLATLVSASAALLCFSTPCQGQAPAPTPFAVRFEQPTYTQVRTQTLATNIIVDPVPPEKLFSYGLMAQITGGNNGLVGILNLTPVTSYDFNGPAGGGAPRTSTFGEGAVKGTSDFFATGLPALANGVLARMVLQPLPVGTYTMRIVPYVTLGANEQLFVAGNQAVSDPVMTFPPSTLVVENLPADAEPLATPRLNVQTGLLMQSFKLTNNTARTPTGLRVWIDNLPLGVKVTNGGLLNGRAYIDYLRPLLPGTSATLQVVLRSPNPRIVINPRYSVEEIPATGPPPPAVVTAALDMAQTAAAIVEAVNIAAAPAPAHIQPIVTVLNGMPVLDFATDKGMIYIVQYSADLKEWDSAQPVVVGTGARAQWSDSGPPRTKAAPLSVATRFYRVAPSPAP